MSEPVPTSGCEFEAVQLEGLAEWKYFHSDVNASGNNDADAVSLLRTLAELVRAATDTPAGKAFDNFIRHEIDSGRDIMSEARVKEACNTYRNGIGISHFPTSAGEYLEILVTIARRDPLTIPK